MELKNLTLDELKKVSLELQREINEREQKIFEEDCEDLAKRLREFLNKRYELCCFVEIECEQCYSNTEIDLWDYMENVIDDLERNYKQKGDLKNENN